MPPRLRRRVLRELAAQGAWLLIGPGEQVGVFRRGVPGAIMRIARAAALELRASGALVEVGRHEEARAYRLSPEGWSLLKWLEAEAQRPGDGFQAIHALIERREIETEEGERRSARVNIGENPVGWLYRRRGRDGERHLTEAEFLASERLRADFERAQLGPRVTRNWAGFLTAGVEGRGIDQGPSGGAEAARKRLMAAMKALGPGLSDAAFRVCCFGEGLEAVEKGMGWASRSGKVVLKIALGRLAEFYGVEIGEAEETP